MVHPHGRGTQVYIWKVECLALPPRFCRIQLQLSQACKENSKEPGNVCVERECGGHGDLILGSQSPVFLMLLLLETRVSLRLNRAGMGKGFYLENSCREIMNDLKFS